MASTLEALSKLRENKTIFLRPVQSPHWDKSRVEMSLGRLLHVAHPMEGGRLKKAAAKEDIEVGFSIGEEFFTFFSVILEARRKPIPLLVLQRPSANELVKVQRRISERVDTLVPLSYEIDARGASFVARHTLALNLSATGVALNAGEPISPGTRLKMEIHLPNITGSFSAAGATVACSRILGAKVERYKVRVRFDALAKSSLLKIEEFIKWKKEENEKWK